MKKYIILAVLACSCLFIQAKGILKEKVIVQLDKECYISGEDVWLNFQVWSEDSNRSSFSKVGYIEICDTKRPYVQYKLALKQGVGEGKIVLPLDMPSGIYQLTGYTRYMMNDGAQSFFKKLIAVINVNLSSDADRIQLIDEINKTSNSGTSNVSLSLEKKQYSIREKVRISLDGLPQNIDNLTISVNGNNKLTVIPQSSTGNVEKQIKTKWYPEYEGHILLGTVIPVDRPEEPINYGYLSSSLSVVGKDIRYIQGNINNENNIVSFNSGPIYGNQEIVTSITSVDERLYRLDVTSPFATALPKELPILQVKRAPEELIERSIGMQLQRMNIDSLNNKVETESYYNLPSHLTYNLDEYTRFNTMSETFLEFVRRVTVSNVNGKKRIRVFLDQEKRYNTGNTLVLLDGVPVLNHEDIISYNPRNVETINIYCERYIFGGEIYDCIVSFITRTGNLPFMQLSKESQLFLYQFPDLPQKFESPEYDENNTTSRKPDLRHTLYWNTFKKEQIPPFIEFYTSDLKGEYVVDIKGISGGNNEFSGKVIFEVK